MSTLPVVMGVGVATLDIVSEVGEYPAEDSEVRADGQRFSTGGNAANTLRVLASLGHACRLGAVLVEDLAGTYIRKALLEAGISLAHCATQTSGRSPVSTILVGRSRASRSIVHFRDVREYGFDDFVREQPGHDIGWMHFEGRNPAETVRMIGHVRVQLPGVRCSVEIEKQRPGLDALYGYPDVLMFSRNYVRSCGCRSAGEWLSDLAIQLPDQTLVCAWGEQGAWAWDSRSGLLNSPAAAPGEVVDTLGAGDVFNAGIIHTLSGGGELSEAIATGCAMAGASCGHRGLVAP